MTYDSEDVYSLKDYNVSHEDMAGSCMNRSLLDLTNFTSESNCYSRIAAANQARRILMLGMPNPCNWNRAVLESPVWEGFFHASTVVWTLAFLSFALVLSILVVRRHSVDRFKVKTTVAVLVTLAVLGFSRTALCINMSVALGGLCSSDLVCLIFIRLFDALGFPSLTASYTLVFMTLVLASKVKLGPDCMQRVGILIPFSLFHYVVAVTFEVVGLASPGPALFSLLACEAFYTIWGIIVCIIYIVVGVRLMRQIRRSIRQTSLLVKRQQKQRAFTFPTKGAQRPQRGEMKMTREVKRHHHRALRKITILTYLTAGLGIMYSLTNVVRLAYNFLLVQDLCVQLMSHEEGQDPIVWLVLLNVSRTLELLLGILLAYSVTDIEPFINFCKRIMLCDREDACDLGTVDGRSPGSGGQLDSKELVAPETPAHDSEENLLEKSTHIAIHLPQEEVQPSENGSNGSSVAVEHIDGTGSIAVPSVIIIEESPSRSFLSPPPSFTSPHHEKELRRNSASALILEKPSGITRKISCPAIGGQAVQKSKGLSLSQDTYAVIGVSLSNIKETADEEL